MTQQAGVGPGGSDLSEDTIAALSTPPGRGWVVVLRISGPEARGVAGRVAEPPPAPRRGSQAVQVLVDAAGRRWPASAWVMPGPGNYTGEDQVELHFAGGPVLAAMVLERVLAAGARLAEPGEFTRRAFFHGRLDLARAEAVIEVIHARTEAAHRLALRQLDGGLSRAVQHELDALTELTCRIEAALDFSDQDIEIVASADIAAELTRARAALDELLRRAVATEVADALPGVLLVGPTGAGKSSLFNRLVSGARAIVTGEPGTTRDGWMAEIDVGVRVRLMDTAGARATADPVERAAQARAEAARASADLVLVVAARPAGPDDDTRRWLAGLPPERTLGVLTKADLGGPAAPPGWIDVSARTGAGLAGLRAEIHRRLTAGAAVDHGALYLLNVRQRDVLRRAGEALERAALALSDGLGLEFVAEDVRQAMDAFGEILGRVTPDELLGKIFARFCIGK